MILGTSLGVRVLDEQIWSKYGVFSILKDRQGAGTFSRARRIWHKTKRKKRNELEVGGKIGISSKGPPGRGRINGLRETRNEADADRGEETLNLSDERERRWSNPQNSDGGGVSVGNPCKTKKKHPSLTWAFGESHMITVEAGREREYERIRGTGRKQTHDVKELQLSSDQNQKKK